MPKLNPYLVKENIVKTEEVRYLDEQIKPKIHFAYSQLPQGANVSYFSPEEPRYLTLDEWKQLNSEINPDEVRIFNKDGTYISWKAGVDYPPYGPGFWDEIGEGLAEVGKFGLKYGGSFVIGTAIVATGPFAIPIGAGVAFEGYAMKKMAETCDSDIVRGVGGFVGDTVMGGGVGGVTGGLLGTGSSSLASRASRSALENSVRTAGTNGSQVLLKAWIYTKAGQIGYELGGKGKSGLEAFCHYFHGQHRNRGIDYDSECPVCNGHFDKYFFWI